MGFTQVLRAWGVQGEAGGRGRMSTLFYNPEIGMLGFYLLLGTDIASIGKDWVRRVAGQINRKWSPRKWGGGSGIRT